MLIVPVYKKDHVGTKKKYLKKNSRSYLMLSLHIILTIILGIRVSIAFLIFLLHSPESQRNGWWLCETVPFFSVLDFINSLHENEVTLSTRVMMRKNTQKNWMEFFQYETTARLDAHYTSENNINPTECSFFSQCVECEFYVVYVYITRYIHFTKRFEHTHVFNFLSSIIGMTLDV